MTHDRAANPTADGETNAWNLIGARDDMHHNYSPPRTLTATTRTREFRRPPQPIGRRQHGQADSRLRPLARRPARIARPALVRIRSRKPCVLARRRLFGWKVRFIVGLLRVREGKSASRLQRINDTDASRLGQPNTTTSWSEAIPEPCGSGRHLSADSPLDIVHRTLCPRSTPVDIPVDTFRGPGSDDHER